LNDDNTIMCSLDDQICWKNFLLKFQAIAEKTAKKSIGNTFLPHPVHT